MNTLKTLGLGFLLLFAGVALAHTRLSASVPADEAVLTSALEQVELAFSEPVRLTALTIEHEGGAVRKLGPLPAAPAEAFSLATPDLSAGHYTVAWRAMSSDTHVMTGEFTFTVEATQHSH